MYDIIAKYGGLRLKRLLDFERRDNEKKQARYLRVKVKRRDGTIARLKEQLKTAKERIVELEKPNKLINTLMEKEQQGDFHAKVIVNQVKTAMTMNVSYTVTF